MQPNAARWLMTDQRCQMDKSDHERIVAHFEAENKNVCVHGKRPKVLSDFGWIAVECDSCCRYTDGEGHTLSAVLATWLERFGG